MKATNAHNDQKFMQAKAPYSIITVSNPYTKNAPFITLLRMSYPQ